MSFHMSQQLPKINDKALLRRALSTLNFAVTELAEPAAVRGYGNEILAARCEVVLRRESTGLAADIGFHQDRDGSFTLVSDSYANKNLNLFMANLKRTYEEEKAIAKAQNLGYKVVSRGRWIQRGEERLLQLRLAR